jgi:hypothetical protein
MKFAKITNILLWSILGISIILIVSLMANITDNKEDPGMNSWLSTNLRWSYFLLIVAFAGAVILEFVNTISDKKALKSALTAIGFLCGVLLLSYLFADSSMPTFYGAQKFIDDGTVTPSIIKWIGTGLIATYILSAISIVAIIWSSVSRIFK